MDARRIAEWLRISGSRAVKQHGDGMPMPITPEGAAEGTTTVVYPDGRVEQSNWSMAGAEAPPGAP